MMKKLLTLIMSVALSVTVFGQKAADLFFSEYIEASVGSNKAVEIYNGTGATIDLSNYAVKLWANGATVENAGTTWGNILNLTGTISSGDVYVIYNSDAATTITLVGDTASKVTYFNGNDIVGLFKNETLIDVIGITGAAAFVATGWDVAGITAATKDHSLVRKDAITSGNTDWDSSRGTTTENSEWIVYNDQDYSHIGWHINQPTSNAADILTFVVTGQQGASVINATAHTVDFEMPIGSNLSALAPVITVSDGATISPASGVAQNFSSAIVYTVTAEDQTTQLEWTVTAHLIVTLFIEDFESTTSGSNIDLAGWTNYIEVGTHAWTYATHSNNLYAYFNPYSFGEMNTVWLITPAIDLSNSINEKFSFDLCVGYYKQSGLNVLISENYNGTNVGSATWTDITSNFSIPTTPTSGFGTFTSTGIFDLSNYTSKVYIAFRYVGGATSSQTTAYEIDNVKVTSKGQVNLNTETDIKTFTLDEQFAPATIDTDNHTVTMQVVYGTALTALVPTITLSDGATIDPASGVAQDFTEPVVYTVTAEDGTTEQDWTVTITEAAELSHAADFLTFSLEKEIRAAVINLDDTTVTCTVTHNQDVSALTPEFTYSLSAQVSPTAGITDFTQPVTYEITAQDGTTRKYWVVSIERASNLAEIAGFTVTGISGDAVIDGTAHTVSASVFAGTNITSMQPTFTISEGATITPTVAQDFTTPKVYTVTSEDTTVSVDWTVTITVAPADSVSIYDIQYTTDAAGESPLKGKVVKVVGVVTAVDYIDDTYTKNNFFIQDSSKGWNGLYVYNSSSVVTVGNKVEVEGTISEYNKLTEISNVTTTIISADATLPTPVELTSVNDVKAEQYESVLIKLNEIVTCKTATISSRNWSVRNDAGDTIQIHNQVFKYEPTANEVFNSITGTVTQFTTSYQICPRIAGDLIAGINENALNQFAFYPNPVKNQINLSGIENVSRIAITNLIGQTLVITDNSNNTISVANLNPGLYLITVYDNLGNYRTEKFIKE